MGYGEAWTLQRRLVEAVKERRTTDHLLVVEHDHVLTFGRRSRQEHVLLSPDELAARGVSTFDVERGGDVTYHGPGQLVAYPILDLAGHRRDVRWFARTLLEATAATVRAFGIDAIVREGLETGVWVPDAGPRGERKVAALGVRVERWVTFHGVALNVDPDLSRFGMIVPCGLSGVTTTSLTAETGAPLALGDVTPVFLEAFAAAFGVMLERAPAIDPAADGAGGGRDHEES